MSTAHRVALPGTEWLVWRPAVLRATGFPADGLDRFTAPDCAAAADEWLAGRASTEQFGRTFDRTIARGAACAHAIAADPAFREAVTWQSRSVIAALDGIVAAGPNPVRHRKHRERERILARYWQRYCAKAETIGFFGPVCWISVDPDSPAITVKPGAGLIRDRRVFLEHWALTALADRVAADPVARRWLPPARQPHLTLRGRELLDPTRPPRPLSKDEADLLARCDGRLPANRIAADRVADPDCALRSEDDVYLLLDRLVDQGLVRWQLDLPVRLDAEQVLRDRLAAIGDRTIRERALADVDRVAKARDAVAAAAGDPDALAAAFDRLDTEFAEVTGRAAARRPGQMYAGRGICWEETTRDLDVTVGGDVLAVIGEPLAVLLRAARWVTARMVRVYSAALREVYQELRAESGQDDVPLSQVWFLAQALFYGTGPRPADTVAAELADRWVDLFGLADLPPGTTTVTVPVAEAATRAERLFAADRPGWSAARLHSPDLQLCATDPDAINRGEFTVVLGELHVAWATNTCGVFLSGHPDPDSLRAALRTDLGAGRLLPLLPLDWPRYSSRLAFALEDYGDAQLGFAPAPGADPDRLVPIGALVVRPDGDELVAVAPDGRRWPLPEVFDRPLAEVSVEAFKLATGGAHTPRLCVGRMVVARRTWRTTIGACPLVTAIGDRERYLAARRWRAEIGLPDRVFVKIASETKPTYTDLTSPLFVSSLATMLRSARQTGGLDVPLTISETLPDTDECWVPDATGRRYVSELRLHLVDPMVEPGATEVDR
ncbi:MAG TPA: lantibiotic dehydratase [Pseudonocardiaceae bacterium]|nr:lantibiotic dehydratase [Pseudonocardiaceae bacterium]